MVKCQWSIDGLCQCFAIRGTDVHPSCNGERRLACRQGELDLVDIRFPEPKKNPGRGGHRVGAGAPRGNLNAIKSGVYSQQLKQIRIDEIRILHASREARERRNKKRQAGEER